MGVRIYPKTNKQGLHYYHKEEWEYNGTVERKYSKATLEDICKYGKLEHILEILSYLSIMPVKLNEILTDRQIETFISNITLLGLFSKWITGISRIQNSDPIESLTLSYRKAFSNTVHKWELNEERALGIPITKIKREDLLMEMFNKIRIKELAKLSMIDDKFRVTLPRLYTRMLKWKNGTEVLVVPYKIKKYGSGFFITTREEPNTSINKAEENMELLIDFTKQVSYEIDSNSIKKLIEQEEGYNDLLPKKVANWFNKVLH